eukprot:986443-Rhodomonas_salina.1
MLAQSRMHYAIAVPRAEGHTLSQYRSLPNGGLKRGDLDRVEAQGNVVEVVEHDGLTAHVQELAHVPLVPGTAAFARSVPDIA